MRPRVGWRLPVSMIVGLQIIIALALGSPVSAQNGAGEPVGLPQDWSHRHLIYSNPDTQDEAARNGTLGAWIRKANDPRFLLQLEKRMDAATAAGTASGRNTAAAQDPAIGARTATVPKRARPKPGPPPQIHRDWSNVMGGASGAGDARTYPAKFSFTIDTKSCTDDFVVFTTSTAGADSVGTFYGTTGTFTGVPVAGESVALINTIYNPNQVLTLTADASLNAGLKFAVGASASQAATNLANAIARNGGTVGLTATSSAGVVTLTSITTNIKKGDITPAEGLTNFTWSGAETDGTGTEGQPTIFALNQLYADTANGGCQTATQAVPAVYWSYNTGTGAIAELSPVLSFHDNGAQVAFVQRVGTAASLVLLKWSASSPGTLGVPTTPTPQTLADYRACTAPCMVTVSLGANNTNSAPFVDYGGDILYVGDDTGRVHKFTGVFQGTPAEVGTPWPVTVVSLTNANNALSSPVFDPTSGLVFVGSNGPGLGPADGNRLHSINASTGAVISAGVMGSVSNANGVRDGPIVDSTGQRVYAFIGGDNGAPDSLDSTCTASPCQAVYQFVTTTSLATQNGGLGAKVVVGAGGNQNDLTRGVDAGAFDSAYFLSGTGSLYVCGSQMANDRRPTLWKITLSSHTMIARTEGPQISNGGLCSPVTIFNNGSEEFLFASVSAQGSAPGGGGCTTVGCIYSYNLSTVPWGTTATVAGALNARIGTGGIIVDNNLTGGGSQVYFSTRSSPGIAVQATQAGLQ